jgi:ABC-type transport system involved in cytochrome c biogenesis permease subunit
MMADPAPEAMPGSTGRTPSGRVHQIEDDVVERIIAQTRRLLMPLASLKLTVVLLAMAGFIVFVGTLAQARAGIWEVVDQYFRINFSWDGLFSQKTWNSLVQSAFVQIDLPVFFPRSFFPDQETAWFGGPIPGYYFLFPKGWTIGVMMAINLVAAHGLRFKVQAKGNRLWGGLALIVVGILVTCLVIISGDNKDGMQSKYTEEWWSTLWAMMRVALATLWMVTVYAIYRLKPDQKLERWILVPIAAILLGLLGYIIYAGEEATLSDPSMRILWQLIKGTFAGVVLLGGCIMLFKKRAGIVLLHSGVGLMMFSELLVGTTAIEARMTLFEGDTRNYVFDIREVELAVIDTSDPDEDDVVVVPEKLIKKAADATGDDRVISDKQLPFDVEVVQYMVNSSLVDVDIADQERSNPATAGAGLKLLAVPLDPVPATDGDKNNLTASYLRFTDIDSGELLGTHLVGLLQSLNDAPESVTVDGVTYEVYLRFKRTYKPYTVNLIDVRRDDYIGTTTPMNYSSDIRLVDPSRKTDVKQHIDVKVHIWMNNPLRYAGETFYQSGHYVDPRTGKESTTLQVVTNTGWMIPYVSCMIVAVGMLAQFWLTLLRFLTRRDAAEAAGVLVATLVDDEEDEKSARIPEPSIGAVWLKSFTGQSWPQRMTTLFPFFVVAFCGLYMMGKALPPRYSEKEANIYEAGKAPVVYEGRIKPLDTLARTSLRRISDQQDFLFIPPKKNENDEDFADPWGEDYEPDVDAATRQPAMRWFLDLVADSDGSGMRHRVIKIDSVDVLKKFGLERRKDHLYPWSEFNSADRINTLNAEVEEVRKKKKKNLTPYDRKIVQLSKKLRVLDMLRRAFRRPPVRDDTPEMMRADLLAAVREFEKLSRLEPPLSVPPSTDSIERKWQPYSVEWTKALVQSNSSPKAPVNCLTRIFVAYDENKASDFNEAVADYRAALKADPPSKLNIHKLDREAYFNHVEPFIYSGALYLVAFVLAACAWLGWSRPLNRASFWLIALTLAIHTAALCERMYISGRPPVTNLYSSAIFIGWGGVILGMICEMIFRNGFGSVVASLAGFSTLLIAHLLTTLVDSHKGDSITMMQAVLDSQFWLATHVTMITFGYATTFIAGIMGVLYIFLGVATPLLRGAGNKILGRMIYGILCFSIWFSFVGTVLGGLWADDSWGRFWGWDPKENGALIIVIWNALVLHARWGGMVKERGTAVLVVFGNIVVAWSWFGVNELGVGLHSYGFTEGVLKTLAFFALSQFVVIACGLLPKKIWLSFYDKQDAVIAEMVEEKPA